MWPGTFMRSIMRQAKRWCSSVQLASPASKKCRRGKRSWEVSQATMSHAVSEDRGGCSQRAVVGRGFFGGGPPGEGRDVPGWPTHPGPQSEWPVGQKENESGGEGEEGKDPDREEEIVGEVKEEGRGEAEESGAREEEEESDDEIVGQPAPGEEER